MVVRAAQALEAVAWRGFILFTSLHFTSYKTMK
jgi:hypothetical protein